MSISLTGFFPFAFLPYSSIQNTIDYLGQMTRLFTPSVLCMVIEEHLIEQMQQGRERRKKRKRMSVARSRVCNQDDYFFFFFSFSLKTIEYEQGELFPLRIFQRRKSIESLPIAY